MELKQVLQKLKYCNRYERSLLRKEIIKTVSHIGKNELLDILKLLNETTDMEYQVKIVYILTAYILLNNSCRDVIIKSMPLYDTLSMILARGLPLKTAITLNFITCLLYSEDVGVSRSRSLTLYTQNLIRNSGCLTAMSQLFTHYMLHTQTWQALCRCLAEVCRGSNLNQNYCSHLVPICVQRCLRENPDVLPVLQSLLFNHKHNTKLFLETDGASIFNRKHYLRLEICLQLLNTVIQNAEVEAISSMLKHSRVYENLQDLLKTNSSNLNIVQWSTIVLYYLDLKLRESGKCYNDTRNSKEKTLQMNSNINDDTQILLHNIMTEVFSYPSKLHNHSPLKLCKVTDLFPNFHNASRVNEETSSCHSKNNKMKTRKTLMRPPLDSRVSRTKKLSFSFLMDESFNFDQTDYNKSNNSFQKLTANQTDLYFQKFTQSQECPEYSKLCDTLKTFNSKCENMTEFKPTFVSTPKRLSSKMFSRKNEPHHGSFTKIKNNNSTLGRTIMKKNPNNKKTEPQNKQNIKHRSMTSRLLEAINESCTTVIRSVKSVFTGNKTSIPPIHDTENTNNVNNKDHNSYCSYSFTNYMLRREAELTGFTTNKDISNESDTLNTVNICNTCDDTVLLQQKFANDERLKSTVKKLKLGINLYGCDFKRISKAMWPQEKYMTPSVLYNLYRKLLLK